MHGFPSVQASGTMKAQRPTTDLGLHKVKSIRCNQLQTQNTLQALAVREFRATRGPGGRAERSPSASGLARARAYPGQPRCAGRLASGIRIRGFSVEL